MSAGYSVAVAVSVKVTVRGAYSERVRENMVLCARTCDHYQC